MTSAQRTIWLTGVASGVMGLVAVGIFLFAPLRTVYIASSGFTGPRQISMLQFPGARGTLFWPVVLCLLLLLGIAAGARWQVRSSQTTGGAVLLWTATALLGVVISNQNILIAPLDAFLLPSLALALVSSFTIVAAGLVAQPTPQ